MRQIWTISLGHAATSQYRLRSTMRTNDSETATGLLKIRCDKRTQHKFPYLYTTNISLFSPANRQERALFVGFQLISYGLTILAAFVQWLVERRPVRGHRLKLLYQCQAARD